MAYGQLRMDVDLARAAVARLAGPSGRSVEETAQAIIDIAVSEMFVEVEKMASRSGVDLRDFALMPFGGGGPMLGAFLARELGLARVIAPRRPGVVSALGGLVADLRGEFIRTVFAPLDAAALPGLRSGFDGLAEEGLDWLQAQAYHGPGDLRLSADMRYAGQSYEIEVSLEADWLGSTDRIAQAFHETHLRIYDFQDPDGQIEIVNLRLSALGITAKPDFPAIDATPTQAQSTRHAPVWLTGWADVPIYDRAQLGSGAVFDGPAIVAQEDTTFAVPAGARASVDGHLNIQLELGA
jgi:N-methylhydantoinase A